MKKLLTFAIIVLTISLCLTSCGVDVARPEVKNGRFNITLTYEHDGEIKNLSGVYVCEYDGIVRWTVNSDPYVNWKTHFEGELNSESIPLCTTDDGGEIIITLFLYPEYFMGDPECADHTPFVRAEILYDDHQIDDADIIAQHGIKIVDFKYDEPIQNTFS